MNDINKKILQAMKEHPDDNYIPEDEADVLRLIGRSFKGMFRITLAVVVLLQVVFAGLAIYCAYQMLNIDDIGTKIHWASGAIATFIVFGLLRIWLFMELNRLSVLREMKRVELQIALLANNL